MCVDYTDLNKECKKDPFDLPRIDQVVDSTTDCNLLSFLDSYLGYHQIPLKEEDQIKTSFITLFSVFCYTTMSFRLKSAGATYERGVCILNSGTTLKRTLIMWSLRLGKMRDSSLTWQRPLTT
jgi:hypothetical protein